MTNSTTETEKANLKKPQGEGAQVKIDSRLARLSLVALGVVFGDICTSPIYAIRECFHGEYGIEVSHPPNKIEGDAVFLAGSRSAVPVALAKNVKHNHVVHTRTILLHFRTEDLPRIPSLEKIQTEKLGGGFYRIVARYGFMEDPSLANVFSLARGQGLDLNPETTSFYIGRGNLVIAEPSSMARWRASLFMFMSRNAADATSFFRLPVDQVIEVGVRLAI